MIKALSEVLRKVEGKEEKRKEKEENKEQKRRNGKRTNKPYVIEMGIHLIDIERTYNVTSGGARGVMVIVARIGHSDASSNPGLIAFHIALIPLGKV